MLPNAPSRCYRARCNAGRQSGEGIALDFLYTLFILYTMTGFEEEEGVYREEETCARATSQERERARANGGRRDRVRERGGGGGIHAGQTYINTFIYSTTTNV